ncbi:zinc-dependent alcohol dehydrogenase family protein [Lentzea nigeriaca]|uniref:zinc-dependent alcohol dehydrogenase family protein n=1 Tax=Lentzea nigeriaca TaxID=1128665 RepID=UPI001EF90D89|nr:NAD(P)-dependent alcohol dehydrogenase [Lentzea nigeriaca]MBM7858662.1 NADPH:quinone reductase-like Zn-dependent oxidoreductase [Lentzea nigeriaca]
MTEKMRSWRAASGAGIDGLTLREEPVPVPGPGEVLVAVRAVSLGFRELLVLRGTYVLPVKEDLVPVSDGAGEVVAVGPGVERTRVGDRVTAGLFPSWVDGPFGPEHLPQLGGSLDGMLAELVVLPESALVAVPRHLSFAEAATLPCAGVTAWNALSGVRAGDTVVTLGTGGVSLFAAQFAGLLGADVIATTSGEDKARRLKALGAHEVLNHRATPDWPAQVRESTGGRGAHRVVDVVGDLPKSLRAVAVAGEVALVGFVAGDVPMLDPRVLFGSGASVRSIAVGSQAQFLAMNRAIEAGGLRPVLDREFEFEDAAKAFRYYEDEQPFGKVVITVS